MLKVYQYNQRNVYNSGSSNLVAFRDMISAQILHKNCYDFLSCDGALLIYDNKVNIPLLPEYESKFKALKLDNYITLYSDIDKSNTVRPKNKSWPIHYLREYVARVKKRLPEFEIVQCGGEG